MNAPLRLLLGTLTVATLSCGSRAQTLSAGPATCATVEVLHPGVRVGADPLVGDGRVDVAAAVETTADGRALVHTDLGLALRLAGDTRVSFPDGRPRVERGRVFVTGWGDDERPLDVGPDARVGIGDAALEVERDVTGGPAGTRVIAVRGEVSYRQGSRQGQLAQGESLEGTSALAVRPAGVWDDWTGGAASPQGMRPRDARGTARLWARTDAGEAPIALSLNELRVQVVVRGDLAETVVEQRFFNGSDRAVPVEYRLRVPQGALVRSFAVERGENTVEGRPAMIASRNASGGGSVALLGTHKADELVAGLGYLSPGEHVRVALGYTAWLSRDGAHRAYVLPLGDPNDAPRVGEFALDMDLSRAGGRSVRLPDGARFVEGRVQMRRSDWRPRSDLVVDLVDHSAPVTPSARGYLSAARGADGHDHLLVDLNLPRGAEAEGTDLALVLDTSAATTPGALEVARAAVDAMLHQAGANDRVALLLGDLGGRPAEGPAGRMERVTPARREAILDAIAHARPGGASDLGRMILDAQATLDARRNGAVFYLGDATPTVGTLDPARLADEVGRAAPDLRLYALSLGHDSHPEVLAALTGSAGGARRVEDATEAVAEATGLLAHALRPCLRDVTFALGPTVTHPLPTRVAAWVAGDPLRVVGELTGNIPREITVRARVGTEARVWRLPLRAQRIDDRGDLGRRWAQHRVDALLGLGSGSASVAELGARYGLVTPVSGLVLDSNPGAASSVGGYVVNAPLYDLDDLGARLPGLGVAGERAPRGVRGFGERPEVALATDDGSGWQPHQVGTTAGLDARSTLAAALAAAEPAARACVERKRALRPGLQGALTVSATLDAQGRVTGSGVSGSTLGDSETESCIRRAVAGLTLPPLELFGATPMTVERVFTFGAPSGDGRGFAARRCPATANLPRPLRRALWRERLGAQGVTPESAKTLWDTAQQRCELRSWEDRIALLEILLDALPDPTEVVRLRALLDDPTAATWLDNALARRFGPAWAWRAAGVGAYVDWDRLLTRLADPRTSPEARVTLLRAWLTVVPRDIDLRLRLLDALEALGRTREARAVAERLRRDPIADARVRGMVGEFFLRAGDRPEALRTFTEIAEFAPYDAFARGRLGDLLLTYGWAAEAYPQYQTLAALRPGDPMAQVRVALAALAAGREDEGLRTLRRAVESSGGDAAGRMLQSLLDGEVTRVATARPDDAAVRSWIRVARQLRVGRETELVLRWTHPDLGVELRAQSPGETAFATVGDAPLPVGLRVFAPDAALDGTRLVVRAATGLRGRRSAEARVQLLVDAEGAARVVEQTVRFDATHRAFGFVVRDGRLVPEEAPAAEVPPLGETL